ncbi:MAG: hypothetical protein QY310_10915 [Candidatus Jettenia sp. CY-1]|nr:hypothetical protein [Candidatus Jettenia sp.]WKZ17939.1 MAG: hypothetical protein QY310_10915 [Candidatus Jettenia sp. CY-1]
MYITFKSEKTALKVGQGFSLAECKPKGLPYRIEIPVHTKDCFGQYPRNDWRDSLSSVEDMFDFILGILHHTKGIISQCHYSLNKG